MPVRVGPDDGNRIGGNGCEKESDYTDDQQPDQRVVPVVQHAEVKKQVRHDQRCEDADSDHFHRKVFLCTDLFRLHDSRFSFQLFGCQPYGSFDDPP